MYKRIVFIIFLLTLSACAEEDTPTGILLLTDTSNSWVNIGLLYHDEIGETFTKETPSETVINLPNLQSIFLLRLSSGDGHFRAVFRVDGEVVGETTGEGPHAMAFINVEGE